MKSERSDRPEGAGRLSSENAQLFGFTTDSWFEIARRVDADAVMTTLGEYEVLDEAGRGAQGLVFRARQPRTGRPVAIKRMHAGSFATDTSWARFEREIELASRLDHPGIATLLSVEEIEERPFLVMRWVDGVPADEWSDRQREHDEGLRSVARLFLDIADAVGHAHARGVLHCDIKPSNLLVESSGRVQVIDFGLARTVRSENGRQGLRLPAGTDPWAAPEQSGSDEEALDVRTDVFALGALLHRVVFGAMPPLPRATHRDAARRAAPELVAIVDKATARDRDARYATVDALAADVRAWLEGFPVSAVRGRPLYTLRKMVARHRLTFAMLGVLACALIACAASSVRYARLLESERSGEPAFPAGAQRSTEIAEAERNGASRECATHEVLQLLLLDVLKATSAHPQTRAATVRELLDRAASVSAALAERPVRGTDVRELGILYRPEGPWVDPESEASASFAITSLSEIAGRDEESHVRLALGELWTRIGRPGDAAWEVGDRDGSLGTDRPPRPADAGSSEEARVSLHEGGASRGARRTSD